MHRPAPQRCVAHTSAGRPCKRWAIHGGTVCPTHGGSITRVKASAEQRFRDLIHPAITALERLIHSGDFQAVRYVLDYAGFKMADKLETDGETIIRIEYVDTPVPYALERHN